MCVRLATDPIPMRNPDIHQVISSEIVAHVNIVGAGVLLPITGGAVVALRLCTISRRGRRRGNPAASLVWLTCCQPEVALARWQHAPLTA